MAAVCKDPLHEPGAAAVPPLHRSLRRGGGGGGGGGGEEDDSAMYHDGLAYGVAAGSMTTVLVTVIGGDAPSTS